MRVVLSGWFWNRPDTGSGQYLRRLLRTLVSRYPEDEFVLAAPPGHVEGQSAQPGVTLVPVPALPGGGGKAWWEQVRLPRLARRLDADLLHVPYWAPPWWTPVPTVVTVHDLIPLLLPAYRGGPAVRLYTALVSATSFRARLLLTDSRFSAEDIVEHLRVPRARVRAVPLAADEAFRPEPAPDDGERLARLRVTPGYLLYLGGFDVRKNLTTVFRAFHVVRETLGEAARLVVAGWLPATDTPFTPHPRRLMEDVGLDADAVQFVGFVSEADAPALYRGARAFLFPSLYEGFGLPPLEAASCGTPVVASDVSSLPEVVGEGGVLLRPYDVAGMAGALLQLFLDDAFHAKLRERALRHAATFSWEATAAATHAAYREVVPSSA